jgi:hypothetical protein
MYAYCSNHLATALSFSLNRINNGDGDLSRICESVLVGVFYLAISDTIARDKLLACHIIDQLLVTCPAYHTRRVWNEARADS